MLLFTITFGGKLLMMAHHSRAESLFHYFRLEDQVPENHLLRRPGHTLGWDGYHKRL